MCNDNSSYDHQMDDPDDSDGPGTAPPVFKIRNPDPDAIGGGWEWEQDSIGCGEALLAAADYLGPETSTAILARHWFNSDRPGDILIMVEYVRVLHRRLRRPRTRRPQT